jgi:rubrerythrin
MAIRFNAHEVLSMAVRIAENGHRFYARGIEVCQGAPTRALFERLSETWAKHAAHFRHVADSDGLQDQLDATSELTPAWDVELYLQAMVDTQVFDHRTRFEDELSCDLTADAVLAKAIGFEKETVLFFLGMQQLVPERLGRDVVSRLIDEEMRHIAELVAEQNAVLESSN